MLWAKQNKTFKQKVHWSWHHQNAWVFDWQYGCYISCMCFSICSQYSHGYQLRSSSRRLSPLYLCSRFHKGASKEKNIAWTCNFTFRCLDDVLSLNNSISYLDLHFDIDSEVLLRTKLQQNTWFHFLIGHCISSKVPTAPNVYRSQLIFHSLCFISGFHWQSIAANKEARESKVASGDVEIIAWKVLVSIMTLLTVTKCLRHIYAPFVVWSMKSNITRF